MSTVLIAGATGATGRLLVRELLERGAHVRAVARSPEKLGTSERLSVIRAAILDLDASELAANVRDCDAVASCLGHNLTWSGVFAPPQRLVTDATRRLCEAIRASKPPTRVRFVLMNTAGNRNPDRVENVSFAEATVLWLLRRLLPPHADNEQAGEYLRTQVGVNDPAIEWAAVRPDTLVDAAQAAPYDLHPSPTRSAIFDAGKTSRIQVAHFMAELITSDEVWNRWKGQMPVIYGRESDGMKMPVG